MYAGGSFILRSLCAKDTIAFILIIVCVMVFHFFPVAIVGTRRKIRGGGIILCLCSSVVVSDEMKHVVFNLRVSMTTLYRQYVC